MSIEVTDTEKCWNCEGRFVDPVFAAEKSRCPYCCAILEEEAE